MKNKKFIVCTFFLILSGILINNIEALIYQNNSKMHLQNFGQYNESSTAPFGIFTQLESEDGNLAELVNLFISNSKGSIEFIPGVGYTSYIGGNLTVQFELIDGNISRNIIFDENNLASYLIRYNKTSGAIDNGTLVNHINFDNNTKKYNGIIGTSVLTEGTYNITIYINLLNYTIIPNVFVLTIKALTYMVSILFSDPGGLISGPPYYFFIGSNISIEFKLREMGVNVSNVLDENNQATYLIIYNKNTGTIENGILSNNINFTNKTKKYSGILETSGLLEGNYTVKINIDLLNNTFVPRSFTLIVRKKYDVLISITKPREIIAGEKLTVSILVFYGENLEIYFLKRTYIKLTLYINGGELIHRSNKKTNDLGWVNFFFTLPLHTNKISLDVEVANSWNYEGLKLDITNIKIIPSLNFIVMFSFLIGLIMSFTIASILLYIKLVIPNNRKRNRIVNEYKQIFKDLSNIECIFINLKRNGKIIFHKSFISKKINQEKINNYMSSLSLFKDTIKSQKLLKEISYKDKILIFSYGKYIEVSLVLNMKGSAILKKNVKEFIYNFENYYENSLENWQDNLIPYKKIETIFEDKLSFFLILLHKIENSYLDNLSLLESNSKYLFNLTKNLIKETGENSFYISTLLNEFLKRSHKGIAKFFIYFQELRKYQIFTSIHKNSL